MTSYLKSIGVAFAAILAMSAVVASSASATSVEFYEEAESESAGGTVTLKNETGTEDVFGFDVGKVKCKGITGEGVVEKYPTPEITFVKIAYSGCKGPGGDVTIAMNGCDYVYTSGVLFGEDREGFIHLDCPAGKVVEVKLVGCTVTVDGQAALTKVTYFNKGMGNEAEVTAKVELANINYKEDNVGMSTCVHPGKDTNNGTYTGAHTLTNEVGGMMRGLLVG